MATEIERKFLVSGDGWRTAEGVLYRQGYIQTQNQATVRVRLAGDRGYLTIKGPTAGLARAEFEYEIPVSDASAMLTDLCDRPLIEKHRYRIPTGNVVWEVDEFHGDNKGLILAEVELTHPDQPLALPDWVGREVSHDPRYFNSQLAQYPYCDWSDRGA
ncbi:MAG: CYTH domain-containing protein [Elainellaceae cyanobacterium]